MTHPSNGVGGARPSMTLHEAKSIARHLGLTLRQVRSGDYRVNFREGDETTAYYTDDLEDAVNAAVEMARKRACELVGPQQPGSRRVARDETAPDPAQWLALAARHPHLGLAEDGHRGHHLRSRL